MADIRNTVLHSRFEGLFSTVVVLVLLVKLATVLLLGVLIKQVKDSQHYHLPHVMVEGPFAMTHHRASRVDELVINTATHQWRVPCASVSHQDFCQVKRKKYQFSEAYKFEIIKQEPECETCMDDAYLLAIFENNEPVFINTAVEAYYKKQLIVSYVLLGVFFVLVYAIVGCIIKIYKIVMNKV